jgi:hypothetical protein
MTRPIALYAMPRSRGTAVLQACKRSNDLHEAWNPRKFMSNQAVPPLHQSIDHMVTQQQIDAVLCLINQPDTKVKIMGQQLARLEAAQTWWDHSQSAMIHDIWILERDYAQSLHSWLLAEHLGYFLETQGHDRTIVATELHVSQVRLLLHNHVRFYPRHGIRITWDALPTHEFDKSQIVMGEQHSLDRLQLIQNFDWWQDQIDSLLAEWRHRLDSCAQSLPRWQVNDVNISDGIAHD